MEPQKLKEAISTYLTSVGDDMTSVQAAQTPTTGSETKIADIQSSISAIFGKSEIRKNIITSNSQSARSMK